MATNSSPITAPIRAGFTACPYWPDYESFARVDHVALERFQRKFGLDRTRRHLLFSGRLVPQKRVDLLLDAFAAIAAERPDWDLLIAGDGVLGDELRQRVPQVLRSRVVWTGFLEQEDLKSAYHASDVLVLPSDYEPWALVVQEAMAAGLVVVSSDVAGASFDLIEDGISGRIFASGQCNELQQALLQVTAAEDIEGLKLRSRAALDTWRSRTDPVAEIRRALSDAGALPQSASSTIPGKASNHCKLQRSTNQPE